MATKSARGVTVSGAAEAVPNEKVPLDAFLPYLVNRVMSRLNQNLAERLRRHGQSFQNWRVLLVLGMNGRRNFTEVIEDTIIPQSTLSRVIMRMERDGLVARSVDTEDSRVIWLDLTEQGRTVFEDVYPCAYAEYERMVQSMSKEEEQQMISLFRRMVSHVCT